MPDKSAPLEDLKSQKIKNLDKIFPKSFYQKEAGMPAFSSLYFSPLRDVSGILLKKTLR
ncbi:hypothetical protein [Bartonella phoceensis]|uniref:hypothetical protein n=1 Tax=Bartonella phoceensis TaxID=270249 RepID=UPI001ABA7721|nr:hypothetical protein [Bartonella phoceensis]